MSAEADLASENDCVIRPKENRSGYEPVWWRQVRNDMMNCLGVMLKLIIIRTSQMNYMGSELSLIDSAIMRFAIGGHSDLHNFECRTLECNSVMTPNSKINNPNSAYSCGTALDLHQTFPLTFSGCYPLKPTRSSLSVCSSLCVPPTTKICIVSWCAVFCVQLLCVSILRAAFAYSLTSELNCIQV